MAADDDSLGEVLKKLAARLPAKWVYPAFVLVLLVVVLSLVFGQAIAEDRVVAMVALAGMLLLFVLTIVLYVREKGLQGQCRQVPIYPPSQHALKKLKAALADLHAYAVESLQEQIGTVEESLIRANIFLMARIDGGADEGKLKLVIHPELAINMDHPPELQLQLEVGQGATGHTFAKGTYHLTRRLDVGTGTWERKFRMTDELAKQIHPELRWIVSFPLVRRPESFEAIGVLNIDGLVDIPSDGPLHSMAGELKPGIDEVGKYLGLQPAICIHRSEL